MNVKIVSKQLRLRIIIFFLNKTSIWFMFKSSIILIILKITIEAVIKTTKIEIKLIEKELITKIATKSIITKSIATKSIATKSIATKSIEEELALNKEKNNWKSILNNIALLIETETIKTTKAIEITNAANAANAKKTTMNKSTTSLNWDWRSDWNSDLHTESRSDQESRMMNHEVQKLDLCLSSWHKICDRVYRSHCEKKQKFSCHDSVVNSSWLRKNVNKWIITKCKKIWTQKKLWRKMKSSRFY